MEKEELLPLITVPFNGTPIACRVRRLTQAQIYACGGNLMSFIELDDDKKKLREKPSFDEILNYAKHLHEICKYALVEPTYDEIFSVLKKGLDDSQREAELDKIYEELAVIKDTDPKYEELKFRADKVSVLYDLILPDDFTDGVARYALGIIGSDIKNVTEDALYMAAILAKAGNDNPADHLHGEFTDYMLDDINNRAWGVYYQKVKDQKHVG